MTDELDRLLADPTYADALRFALFMAYACGWSDAFNAPLAVADARLAALIEAVGVEWQSRLIARRPIEPSTPNWLAALQDERGPEPWGES
jgi:hypothetical protein